MRVYIKQHRSQLTLLVLAVPFSSRTNFEGLVHLVHPCKLGESHVLDELLSDRAEVPNAQLWVRAEQVACDDRVAEEGRCECAVYW